LKGIIKRLEEMRKEKGSEKIDKLLFEYGGFSVEGIIGEKPIEEKARQYLFVDEKETLVDWLKKQMLNIAIDITLKNLPMPSILDFVIGEISKLKIYGDLKKAVEDLKHLMEIGGKIDFEKLFSKYPNLSSTEMKFLAFLARSSNVTCGTICEAGHEGSYNALDEQLKRQFTEYKSILGITEDRELTEKEVDIALQQQGAVRDTNQLNEIRQ
jgi:hypothetical protein